ncbi:hypothetical protein ABFS82_10G110900 [Erythranthe guttata]|uniref:CCR4-NOT transcription complex subunit 10 n=1 Tax=Erythranthe guttata TaxID=4155 RepID=A0A022PPK3_ERYGU|nr:PREDICTED: CCR4-NOT transcription complex subunit 10-like [Erythranthe guttata]EYU18247.1 hypothetical protein MIMGU_mgv1a001551mg [Erythranthe guttata]|eukprot:XP_012828590.1 PREDICTED: CCR4-NOT transcription complex subunit 10-like [Erythranthe guttata]
MESVPSPLTFVTRDGSPAAADGEDDGALLVAAELSKEAALLFQTGKFVECLRVLNQLLQNKEDDPKVHHNITIAESFQDGYSDPRRIIKALERIKEQNEELARAPGEHLAFDANNESKHTTSMIGSDAAAHPSSSVVYSDEFGTSLTMFNIAVIWYHLHEYAKSFSYLDILYHNIEPIGEGTALRICLLLLDVALLSHNASRSADVISYMEKVFCVNQVDSGTAAHQQSSLVSKSILLPSNSTNPDSSQTDHTSNMLENSLARALSDEALEDDSLHLLSSPDISGRNFQRTGIARIQSEESMSASDLRLKLHFYKVRLFILTRNLKAAKREAKMAMNIARGTDYPLALYLKSQLEYARLNHRKAIKLLNASNNNNEIGFPSLYFNNLGCIYYQLGKHHTSGIFFSKALKNSSPQVVQKEKKSPKLLTLLQDKSLMITYNCGVHSLACGRPFHAARCFQSASLIFHDRPLLWLRIAECCLMALEKGLIINSVSSSSDRSDITVNVIGKGKWRQLGLRQGSPPNGHMSDDKQPALSMSLARQCLVNALYLLDSLEASSISSEETESKENGEVKEKRGGDYRNSVLDYENIRTKENQVMRQATLADLAFVELALGNPSKALSTAKSLMKLPECEKMYRFLGIVYAAEALCLLNKPMEAAEHLMTYVSGANNNVELPYSHEDCEKWTVEKVVPDNDELQQGGTVVTRKEDEFRRSTSHSPEEARGIICANYAANFALMGELEKAQYFVTKALSDIPKSSQAVLTAIYVDIKRGDTQEALAKLKQHSGVRFLRSDLTLTGTC